MIVASLRVDDCHALHPEGISNDEYDAESVN
jgi:hypothetical protein